MKMNFAMMVLAFAIPAMAQAKTITVKGALASNLANLAETYGNADGGMGKVEGNTEAVTCVKHVDEEKYENDEIKCTIAYQGVTKTISTKSQNETESADAMNLRFLLMEATHADKQTSKMEKQLSVKSIDCIRTTTEHEFDSLEIEVGTSCKIKY